MEHMIEVSSEDPEGVTKYLLNTRHIMNVTDYAGRGVRIDMAIDLNGHQTSFWPRETFDEIKKQLGLGELGCPW